MTSGNDYKTGKKQREKKEEKIKHEASNDKQEGGGTNTT